MASIPFGIEFDRISPPVPTIAAAAEYDAARSRRTIDFFFERLRPRCIGRLQRLDGDPATGRNRREGAIHWHQGEGPPSHPSEPFRSRTAEDSFGSPAEVRHLSGSVSSAPASRRSDSWFNRLLSAMCG